MFLTSTAKILTAAYLTKPEATFSILTVDPEIGWVVYVRSTAPFIPAQMINCEVFQRASNGEE